VPWGAVNRRLALRRPDGGESARATVKLTAALRTELRPRWLSTAGRVSVEKSPDTSTRNLPTTTTTKVSFTVGASGTTSTLDHRTCPDCCLIFVAIRRPHVSCRIALKHRLVHRLPISLSDLSFVDV
jgi:hypothetical protein